jgi:hypothetical protein
MGDRPEAGCADGVEGSVGVFAVGKGFRYQWNWHGNTLQVVFTKKRMRQVRFQEKIQWAVFIWAKKWSGSFDLTI